MNDELKPLLAGELEADLRGVLESALDDGPSVERMQAAALALGLGAAATQAALTGAAGQGLVKGASSFWLLKWFGLGLLVGGLSSTGVALVRDEPPPKAASPSAVAGTGEQSSPNAKAPAVPDRAASERADESAGNIGSKASDAALSTRRVAVPEESPELTPGDPEPAAEAKRSFPAAASTADLKAEVLLIDNARRQLTGGNARGALAELGRYDALVGPKRLAPEALMLRVRALVALGRIEEARALAKPVIERMPESAQARQLRAAARL